MALGSINKTVFKGSPILDFTSSYNFVYKIHNTRHTNNIVEQFNTSLSLNGFCISKAIQGMRILLLRYFLP